jgi:hypothetical protein
MRRRKNFRTCPRCGIAMASGEREQSSKWGGASLPMDLEEYCVDLRLRLVDDIAQDPIDQAKMSSEEVRRQEAVPDPRAGRMANRLGEPEITDER